MGKALPVFVALLCACAASAQQQPETDVTQLSIEDLMHVQVETVYGASKFLEKVADAPASVSIVTSDQIQKYGYRTLADVLKSVRGFYVINDRNYTYIGVRGFSQPGDYNARILFLINGHRDNDNIYNGAYVGSEFPVDIDLIDHVEIVRGPGSAVYGAGALVAVINVVTKRGRDMAGWELSGEGGSWNTYRVRASYGRRFNNQLEALLSGTFYQSVGHKRLFFSEFDSPLNNNGVAVDADGDQAYDLSADLIRGSFTLHALINSRTKHVPTASFGTVFDDPRNQTEDARRFIDLQYDRTFANEWDILARGSVDWYGYDALYIYDYPGNGVSPFTQNVDRSDGTWSDLEFDASRMFYERDRLALGAEYRQDCEQVQTNFDKQPYVLYLSDNNTSQDVAYYLQNSYSIRRNLTVNGGLRSDWSREFGATYSPRLGLVYAPTGSTRLKAIYNRAFRAPTRFEEFYRSNISNAANPALTPERVSSYELEVDQDIGRQIHFTASGFVDHIDNLIATKLNPVTSHVEYQNGESWHTMGLEFEMSGNLARGLQGSASWTIQNSHNPQEAFVTNSPHNLAKANLSVPLWRRTIFASAEGQYVSRRTTVAGPVLGGGAVLNATLLARRLFGDMDISANIENLFDRHYSESGGLEHREISIPQDGRSFRLQLIYRFSTR